MLDKKLLFLMMVQSLCIAMDISLGRIISDQVLATAAAVPDHVLPEYPDLLQSMARNLVLYEYGKAVKPGWIVEWK